MSWPQNWPQTQQNVTIMPNVGVTPSINPYMQMPYNSMTPEQQYAVQQDWQQWQTYQQQYAQWQAQYGEQVNVFFLFI